MAGNIAAKQIAKYQSAFVGVAGFSTAGGASDTITTALTTALSTAGNNGVSVPLQAGSGTQEGVDTATGFNQSRIYASGTGKLLQDGNGNDVYGKITLSGSTWSLGYFSRVAGVETAFTMAASTAIDFDFPYIFSFGDLPFRSGTGVSERHVGPDAAAYGFRLQPDPLTVTQSNTLSGLSQSYSGVIAILLVNGVIYTDKDAAPAFSVSGKAVAWNATNAGFALATTDSVTALYSY